MQMYIRSRRRNRTAAMPAAAAVASSPDRDSTVARWSPDKNLYTFLPENAWALKVQTTKKARKNNVASGPLPNLGGSQQLMNAAYVNARYARCASRYCPQLQVQGNRNNGNRPDPQLVPQDSDGDPNQEMSTMRQDFKDGGINVETVGAWGFPWGGVLEIMTQAKGGMIKGTNATAPAGAIVNDQMEGPLWPSMSTAATIDSEIKQEPFTDMALLENCPNLVVECTRFAGMEEEIRTIASHYGTMAGALTYWFVGLEIDAANFKASRLGVYLSGVYEQYARNRSVMLHAAGLARACIAAAKNLGGTVALKEYDIDRSGTTTPWFAPGMSWPGICYTTTASPDTYQLLQMISDIVLVATDKDGYSHELVCELKTRHTEKGISNPTLNGYWRQAVVQAASWWLTCSGANSRYKPHGNSRLPKIHTVLVTSHVKGLRPQCSRTRTWVAEMDVAAVQRIVVSVIMSSAHDYDAPVMAEWARKTWLFDDSLPKPVAVLDGGKFSDHAVALMHDLCRHLTRPNDLAWNPMSPLGWLGNKLIKQKFGELFTKTWATANDLRPKFKSKAGAALEKWFRSMGLDEYTRYI